MSRRKLSFLGAAVMLVAAGWGAAAASVSAAGGCPGLCALGELELTGPPLVASPTVGAGTTSSLTFTLTNDTSWGYDHAWWLALGSAELTAPSGFTIDAASFASGEPGWPKLEVSSGSLQLTDLGLWPGASISVVLSVTASCAASSATWGLSAQPLWAPPAPWHAFSIDPDSALSVGVTGACSLAFVQEPASAVVNTDITSQPFDAGGTPVEVEAADADGNPLGGVDVSLSAELGSSTLAGTVGGVTGGSGSGSFGLVSFSPLTLAETGYYQLEATAPSFVSATSPLFLITDAATTCSGSCSGSASDSSVSVNADVSNPPDGDLLSVVLGGFTYSCPDPFSPTGYYPTTTGSIGVDLWQPDGALDLSDHTVQVTLTIPAPDVRPWPPFRPFVGPAWLFTYQVCYASTEPFSGGTLVSAADSIPGYSGSTYVGLLPNCPWRNPSSGAPCVLSRTWSYGSVLITFLGAPGDFWGSA